MAQQKTETANPRNLYIFLVVVITFLLAVACWAWRGQEISSLTIIVVFAIFCVVAYIASVLLRRDAYVKNEEVIRNGLPINVDKIITPSLLQTVYIDDTQKKIAIREKEKVSIYDYEDILGYEVQEDGESIAQGRMGSALVGGLVFGMAGAVIGSAGSRKQTNKCSDLSLVIFLNNLSVPKETIKFILAPTDKTSAAYKDAKERINEALGAMKYIENHVKTEESA